MMTGEQSLSPPAEPGAVKFPLAGFLQRQELEILKGYVNWQQIPKGGILWQQGETDGRVALIIQGRAKITKEMNIPGHPLVIGLFGPGSLVGDLSFSNESASITSARAVEDMTLVILRRENFDSLAIEHPTLANHILNELLSRMAEQLRHAYERLTAIF